MLTALEPIRSKLGTNELGEKYRATFQRYITIGDRFGRTLVFGFWNFSGDGETFGGFEVRVRIGGHVTFVADAIRSKFVTSDTGVWMIWINPLTRGPVRAYALPLAG